MERLNQNNAVKISGEIVSDFTYDHEMYGEGFYKVFVQVTRISGNLDTIPVMVSDRIIDVNKNLTGEMVAIEGEFRSYNKHLLGANKLLLFVLCKKIEIVKYCMNEDEIFLRGFICKNPIYRKTPFKREISDLLIAVNRYYGKSDYIPCICWGRNARYAAGFEIGDEIVIRGRIQSRTYEKKISDTEFETRTAYEVSANMIEKIGGENESNN
jgi:hypothetical protein